MEALGSRLGRASSRYGQTATVFNGPVRRWKKRWVHVSSSSPSLTYQNPHSQSNNSSSRLLLCRWTPISSATSPDEPAAASDEPPRRKFRYTPVSVLEEQKKPIQKKVGDEEKTSETDESVSPSDKVHGKPNINQIMKEQAEHKINIDHQSVAMVLQPGAMDIRSATYGRGVGLGGASICILFFLEWELDEDESGVQDSNRSHLDLDLGLKDGHNVNLGSMIQMKKASSGRFWLD
ncbi:hypothetical protein C1H46_044064 [Malus baccata]|uniref:Uncharacterized protein n=1 Tax=Malus baccata TaxID=106549 RepID=A0A540K863_MALBA|nr:hypothetical protein C1H46_044064 [Malus baccata]